MVRQTTKGEVCVVSEATTPVNQEATEDILDVICSWWHMWMWPELTLLGEVV